MKKSIWILWLGLIIVVAHAQNTYIPYASPNKYWFYSQFDGGDLPKSVGGFVIWFNSDTTIAETKYLKVFSAGLDGKHPCQFPPCFTPNIPYEFGEKSLIGFVTEDTVLKKVYFLPKLPSDEMCTATAYELYDFGLSIGDSLSQCHRHQMNKLFGNPNFGAIDSMDVIQVAGKDRRRLLFQAPGTSYGMPYIMQMELVEGIGLTYYEPFFYTSYALLSNFCEGSLEDCNIATAVANIGQDKFAIYPNPTHANIKIQGIDETYQVRIIDVAGHLLPPTLHNNEIDLSSLSPGMYVLVITDIEQHQEFRKVIRL